jgi:hypothetical protein
VCGGGRWRESEKKKKMSEWRKTRVFYGGDKGVCVGLKWVVCGVGGCLKKRKIGGKVIRVRVRVGGWGG